jgi:hypothetical protein
MGRSLLACSKSVDRCVRFSGEGAPVHPQKPHAGTDIEPRGASSAPLGGSECQRCCVATSLRVQVRCTSHGLSCRGGRGTRDAATADAERRLYGGTCEPGT